MKESTIYTIGYGGSHGNIASFVRALEMYGIRYLIDVRSQPYSKKYPDFNGDKMKTWLPCYGIGYVYMGDILGGRTDDKSCITDNRYDYGKMAEKDGFKAGLERFVTADNKEIKVCLMCTEPHPIDCHRSKLIGVELYKMGLDIQHIDDDNTIVKEKDVIDKLTGGQGLEPDLFGNTPRFFSGQIPKEKEFDRNDWN